MSRLRPYAPFVILTLYALVCLLFFVDTEWRPQWDSGVYLITAQNLANGQGYIYLGQPYFLKPPGFAYLLTWFIGSDGSFDFYQLNLVMMLFAMGSLVVVNLVMRRFMESTRAFWITLLLGTSPLFVSQFNNVMTEFLFLLLFFSGVLFILPSGKDLHNPLWRGLVGAVLISVSLYVRTAGIVLLPGIILLGIRNESGVKKLVGLGQVLLILVLIIPWIRYASHAAEQAIKPAPQLMTFSYTSAVFHIDPGDPDSRYLTMSEWGNRILINTKLLVQDIGRNTLHGTKWRAYAAAILVCAGFIIVCRRRLSVLDLFVFFYTGVVILYFTYDKRLIFQLVLFFYYYLFIMLSHAGDWYERRFNKKNFSKSFCFAVFALLLLLNIVSMNKYMRSKNYMPLRTAAQWIKANTPKNAKILYRFAPDLAILSDRSVYSYVFLREDPTADMDYVVLMYKSPYFEPDLKRQNLASIVLPGFPEFGGTRIYRVR